MPCRPSTSDHVRASAIWPTAAAAWLSSSFSGPAGSLSTARPSAIAPEETTSTSRLLRCSLAMSATSEESHASCRRPPSLSTSSEEPTFTTKRRKSAREGTLRDMLRVSSDRQATTIVALRRCLACVFGSAPRRDGMSKAFIGTSGWTYDGWRGPFYLETLRKKRLARLVRQPVSNDGNQRFVLPHPVPGCGAVVARSDPARFPVRLEGLEVHHPLEAARRDMPELDRVDGKPAQGAVAEGRRGSVPASTAIFKESRSAGVVP